MSVRGGVAGLLAVTSIVIQATHALQHSFAVDIGARKVDCFYFEVDAQKHGEIIVDYSVSDGGNQDINAYVRSPTGHVVDREHMKREGTFKFTPMQKEVAQNKDWAYSLCLDNSFSQMSSKRVDVDVWGENEDGDEYGSNNEAKDKDMLKVVVEEQVDKLRHMVSDLRTAFRQIFRTQAYLRHRGVRHQSTAEVIHWKVDMWSITFLTLEILIPIAQVLFVRRLLAHAGGSRMRPSKGGAGISF